MSGHIRSPPGLKKRREEKRQEMRALGKRYLVEEEN